jgi:Fur family transcriptional regulator, zinc uptake regulator
MLAPNHLKVFDALRRAGRPVTAYEIIDAVREAGISAPPTVYRALSKLIQQGMAHRVESLNAFVACSHSNDHQGSVVFLICDSCGEAQEVLDHAIETQLRRTSSDCAFHVEQATIELRGRCGICSDMTPDAAGTSPV